MKFIPPVFIGSGISIMLDNVDVDVDAKKKKIIHS